MYTLIIILAIGFMLSLIGSYVTFKWVTKNIDGIITILAMIFIALPKYRWMQWRVKRSGWYNPVYPDSKGGYWTHVDGWVNDNFLEDGKLKEYTLHGAYQIVKKG